MRHDVEDVRTIRRYLLDDLAPEERRRLEERLLDDGDDFFEQVQLAEAELADDYVTGELSDDDRARFREHFLFSSERHEQLRFTELLRGHFATGPSKKTVTDEAPPSASWLQKITSFLGLDRPAVGLALACGLILAVGVVALLGLRAWHLSKQLDLLQATQPPPPDSDAVERLQRELDDERARRESAAQELAHEQDERAGLEREVAQLKASGQRDTEPTRPTPVRGPERPAPAGGVLAFTLLSGGVRGSGETTPLRLTQAATTARLRLDVGAGDYTSFRAMLEDADGTSLREKSKLRAQSAGGGRVVVFDVPVGLFGDGGDFQVTLSGVTREGTAEVVDRYSFRIVRE